MNNGKRSWNNDLNQLEDKAEQALSAQDGGRDADKHLEPTVDEAE